MILEKWKNTKCLHELKMKSSWLVLEHTVFMTNLWSLQHSCRWTYWPHPHTALHSNMGRRCTRSPQLHTGSLHQTNRRSFITLSDFFSVETTNWLILYLKSQACTDTGSLPSHPYTGLHSGRVQSRTHLCRSHTLHLKDKCQRLKLMVS